MEEGFFAKKSFPWFLPIFLRHLFFTLINVTKICFLKVYNLHNPTCRTTQQPKIGSIIFFCVSSCATWDVVRRNFHWYLSDCVNTP
jgi:hypothetical protein